MAEWECTKIKLDESSMHDILKVKFDEDDSKESIIKEFKALKEEANFMFPQLYNKLKTEIEEFTSNTHSDKDLYSGIYLLNIS